MVWRWLTVIVVRRGVMAKDIFRTVRELLDFRDLVWLSNAVNTEGQLYEDSVENLNALLMLKEDYEAMRMALNSMVLNYAAFGRVTDDNVRDAARLLQRVDG
jgi:hypothetical protein